VAQVVGAELQLEPVFGGRLRWVHHAGVVDQQVDAVVVGPKLFCGNANGLQRRQVEFLQGHVDVGTALADQRDGVLALVEVAHRQHDVCALGGECGRGLVAEPGVGAGDDGDATVLVGNVRSCPLGHEIAPKL
jgi:hypothetical protein